MANSKNITPVVWDGGEVGEKLMKLTNYGKENQVYTSMIAEVIAALATNSFKFKLAEVDNPEKKLLALLSFFQFLQDEKVKDFIEVLSLKTRWVSASDFTRLKETYFPVDEPLKTESVCDGSEPF